MKKKKKNGGYKHDLEIGIVLMPARMMIRSASPLSVCIAFDIAKALRRRNSYYNANYQGNGFWDYIMKPFYLLVALLEIGSVYLTKPTITAFFSIVTGFFLGCMEGWRNYSDKNCFGRAGISFFSGVSSSLDVLWGVIPGGAQTEKHLDKIHRRYEENSAKIVFGSTLV